MRPSDRTPDFSLEPHSNVLQQLTRRRLLGAISGIAGSVLASSLLAACGGTQAKSEAPTSSASAAPASSPSTSSSDTVDKIRFAWWTDVGSLSPFQFSTTGPGGVVLLSFVFDTLTWKDDQQIIPWLGLAGRLRPMA